MRIGILSDTHNQIDQTRCAVEILRTAGVECLFHCGDLMVPEIVEICSVLPFYFAFGNHDCDVAHILERAAIENNAVCLKWGGEVTLANKRIAVVHGHLSMDVKPLLAAKPDYLLSGHSHSPSDTYHGSTRRINPGALFRADDYSVAALDLRLDELQFISIPNLTQ